MHLTCHGAAGDVTLGPSAHFRLDGSALRDAGGAPLGVYHHHLWEIGGKPCIRLDAGRRAVVRFEGAAGAAQEFGPFERASVADGAVRGDGRLLATFSEEAGRWRCLADGTDWPAVVLAEA